ncbi:MAG: response regulator transcription factor [Actinomycetota bacterium]
MTAPVSVVLADDSTTIRSMLGSLLEEDPDIDLAGLASDGPQAVEMALSRRPDVVILDVQMPGLDGLRATRRILAEWPEARVILHTAYPDDGLASEACQAGAAGYLTKDQRPSALIATVLKVAQS